MNHGNPRKKFNRMAISTDDYFKLDELIENYVQNLKNTIFVETTSNPYELRTSIFKLLHQHIFEHTIKVGRQLYKQKVGIPQGSVLSTLLCSLYYGDLERTELATITNDPNSVLIRYIDDFLFISTDKNRVKSFSRIMHQGFPQFGVQVSTNKSLVNFELKIDDQDIQNVNESGIFTIGHSRLFPWCGLLIDTSHLDVLHDFTRISETDIKNALTVELNIHPGLAILSKTKQFLRNLCHPIYLDSEFARLDTIWINIYQSFLFCALKFGATVDIAFKSNQTNSIFLIVVVKEAITYQLALLRSSAKPHYSGQLVSYLGYRAFSTILKKKHNKFGNVVKFLYQEMRRYPDGVVFYAEQVCRTELNCHLLNNKF
jgi:telomerase reverse transcriptase